MAPVLKSEGPADRIQGKWGAGNGRDPGREVVSGREIVSGRQSKTVKGNMTYSRNCSSLLLQDKEICVPLLYPIYNLF